MLRGSQFNVAFVLVATLVVAILLAYGHVWPVMFIVGQLLFVYLGSEYLIRNLPQNLKQFQVANCTRADGTISAHRQSIEKKEHQMLLSNFRLTLFIGVAPTLLLLWVDVFDPFNAITACLIWLVFSFFVVRSGYLYFLNQFVFNLKRRAQQYKIRDLDIILREEEIIESHNRERHQAIDDGTAPAGNSIAFSPRPK